MRRVVLSLLVVVCGFLFAYSVAVPVIEAGGGGHGGCKPRPHDGAGVAVEIGANCYSPAVLYVEPGDTVTWTNHDPFGHNVVGFDGEPLGEQSFLSLQGGHVGFEQGETHAYTFDSPGLYPYYCSLHPAMIGVVAVGDPESPEFAAGLSVQTSDQQVQAIGDYQAAQQAAPAPKPPYQGYKVTTAAPEQAPPMAKGQPQPAVASGSASSGGGLHPGLAVGVALLVGLVAVGGGLLLPRRAR